MADHAKSIFVQITIHGSMDELWRLTQTPELHQQWDLRFTEIEYLPRAADVETQRFLYATRIGLGMQIRGEGESIATRHGTNGERSSSLKFWSDDPKSLIETGAGYWKYAPSDQDSAAIQFTTGYDYQVRFGAFGRMFDRLVFRPLMGWATAWSFDRLRLWIEKGTPPATSIRQAICHFIARSTLAFIWLYQGLVPKLILRHSDEIAMIRSSGIPENHAQTALTIVGILEMTLGITLLIAWRKSWLLAVTMIAMPLALISVACGSPTFLTSPFNAVTLNIAVFALAAIAWLCSRDLPSARNCLRSPPKE